MRPVRPAAYWSRTGFLRIRAVFRADAAICHSFSGDRELWAVAALRLAGFSAGRGDCARGGRSARRGGSRAGLCSSCAGRAILSECRVFVRAHHAFLSECRVFVRAHHAFLSECRVFVCAHHAFLSECPAFDHAVLFAAYAPNRTACGMLRSYSAGSRSPFVRSRIASAIIEGGWFTSGLRVFWRRSRRRTRRTRLAAQPLCAFARAH